MASSRATKSGFAAEAQKKMMSKYDEDSAHVAMEWVNARLQTVGESVDTSGSMDNVFAMLGDGYKLAKLMEALGDKSIKNVKVNTMAFKKMELIGQFLTAVERYGVPTTDCFQTVDLYESQNLAQVISCLDALGRKVSSKGGPGFGVKEAERQSREWTDEQLKAGQNIIGLQMGSNKGASQAGQNFGKARMIVD